MSGVPTPERGHPRDGRRAPPDPGRCYRVCSATINVTRRNLKSFRILITFITVMGLLPWLVLGGIGAGSPSRRRTGTAGPRLTKPNLMLLFPDQWRRISNRTKTKRSAVLAGGWWGQRGGARSTVSSPVFGEGGDGVGCGVLWVP